MGLRAFGMFKAPRFAAALAVAGVGVIVGFAGDLGGSSGFGVVRSSSDQVDGPRRATRSYGAAGRSPSLGAN